MKSVIQSEKACFVCGTCFNLHDHHIFYGTANRKLAEKHGYKVYLCAIHHNMSNAGVHFNKDLDLHIKCIAQTHFEANKGTRDDFIRIFGKSYMV